MERVSHAETIEELVRLTAKRSAYTTEQLSEIIEASDTPEGYRLFIDGTFRSGHPTGRSFATRSLSRMAATIDHAT